MTTPVSPKVRQFIHALCVPFALRHASHRDKDINLKQVADALAASPGHAWQPLSPLDMGSGPAHINPDDQVWQTDFHRLQRLAYFHPHVRPLLGDPQRVRRWGRSDVKQWRVDLGPKAPGPLDLDVLRCELWVFQPDTGVLLVELGSQVDQTLELWQVQLLLDTLRRLYPPYVDQYTPDPTPDGKKAPSRWYGGHCPSSVGLLDGQSTPQTIGTVSRYDCTGDTAKAQQHFDSVIQPLHASLESGGLQKAFLPLMPHWQTLLHPLRTVATQTGACALDAVLLGDDRAPIMTWLAFDDARKVSEGDWVRTCFADTPGQDKLPYAKRHLEGFEARHCYDRFWYQPGESDDSPSRILVSGYAFTYAGQATDPWFFCNEKNGAHAIFRHLYVPMGLIAHMQKAQLLSMDQRLSAMVRRSAPDGSLTMPEQQAVEERYRQYIEFSQTAWFDEVTPQEQGQEIFSMWQRALGTQKLHDAVHQTLKGLFDYIELSNSKREALESKRLNTRVELFTKAALALTGMNLLVAMLGLFPIDSVEKLAPAWVQCLDKGTRIIGVVASILVTWWAAKAFMTSVNKGDHK